MKGGEKGILYIINISSSLLHGKQIFEIVIFGYSYYAIWYHIILDLAKLVQNV